jgi:hypothetical protein
MAEGVSVTAFMGLTASLTAMALVRAPLLRWLRGPGGLFGYAFRIT